MPDTALLIMDVQPGIVDRLPDKDEYLKRAAAAAKAARAAGLPVIFVVVGFRAGFPEVSPSNQSFSRLKETASAWMVDPKPSLKLETGDVLVYKRRVSAFAGSDLEVILRAKGIKHLVLCGIATSGVVLSTLRQAADQDFQLTVLSDLSADFDDEVHQVLVNKVFPRQAEVTTAAEWLKTLKK